LAIDKKGFHLHTSPILRERSQFKLNLPFQSNKKQSNQNNSIIANEIKLLILAAC